MSYFVFLINGSENHAVKLVSNGFLIFPTGTSREAVEKFQPIAQEAIENASKEGYVIKIRHESSQYSGGLIDMLLLAKQHKQSDVHHLAKE